MTRVNLRATARRQHGVVTRAQALAAGMTSKQVRWRLQRGDWRRLHRGVYLTNTGRVTWPVRAWAALLWSGEGSLLVEEAAAYVWRLQRAEPAVITVGVPHGRYPPRVVGVRTLQRRRRRRRTVDGFPVSHLAQTVVDLADRPGVSLDDVVSLAARACQQRLVDADSLLTELGARGRHRHRRGLRLALGEIADGAESLPEVWFARRVLRRHGLPPFERQVAQGDGTRVDLRSREYGVNVEVDGQVWHAGERFHDDRRRDRAAAARGEVTLRVTFHEIDRRSCDLAVDLAGVLARRGWAGTPRACSPGCGVRAWVRPGA